MFYTATILWCSQESALKNLSECIDKDAFYYLN